MDKDELRTVIKDSGMSVKEFSKHIGKDFSTVYRWLRGEIKVPKFIELLKVKK